MLLDMPLGAMLGALLFGALLLDMLGALLLDLLQAMLLDMLFGAMLSAICFGLYAFGYALLGHVSLS